MQFSITIGLYMSAMGVGSFLSKYVKNDLFDYFITIELLIGIIGGISALVLFIAYAYTPFYVPVMYVFIIVIGTLVGLEIPILTRIIESHHQSLRVTLANVLSFDYIGGLIGSVAFPLILYPHLGLIRTSFLIGALNIVIAGVIIKNYHQHMKRFNLFNTLFFVFLILNIGGFVTGNITANGIEDKLYRDPIIYRTQTTYQRIVVTKHKEDLRLFLDGNIQFSSRDEYRYHEALVHPVMESVDHPKRVLVLGGGDGLALREIFKYESVQAVDLVDIDEEMVSFCRNNALITQLNESCLEDQRLTIYYQDAFKFLENSQDLYDVVIVDLPDPNNEGLNKLYTTVFYRLISQHLEEDGRFVVQSTSPYFAKKAYWCVNKTIMSEGLYVTPYHLQVPSFGDWGFQLVSKYDNQEASITFTKATRYLNENTWAAMKVFGKDERIDLEKIDINTMFHPVLLAYYEKASYDLQ